MPAVFPDGAGYLFEMIRGGQYYGRTTGPGDASEYNRRHADVAEAFLKAAGYEDGAFRRR